ncbi:MAG: DUF4920 domain-containing protein [Chitinophagales bacterium]|jgi:hypothetical protein|nr:DUF4920 domain-containing protein [Chitinophagales bacterium]
MFRNTTYTLLFFGLISLMACNSTKNTIQGDGVHFGRTIDAKNAQTADAVVAQMQKDNKTEMKTKIKGKVEAVCQSKGCWMMLERTEGEPMRVKFKDYAFFMPKDLAGKTVVVEGIATVETVSVDLLRHYAEDEGKTEEEVNKIITPKTDISFMADGVLIVK